MNLNQPYKHIYWILFMTKFTKFGQIRKRYLATYNSKRGFRWQKEFKESVKSKQVTIFRKLSSERY